MTADCSGIRACIQNRNQYDTIVNGTISLLLALMPVIFFFFCIFAPSLYPQFYVLTSGSVWYNIILGVFCLTLQYINYSMYVRMESHAKRDIEWRESLIQYAESIGAETEGLRKKHDENCGKDKFRMKIPCIVTIAITSVTLLFIVLYPYEDEIYVGWFYLMIIAPILTFLLTIPRNLGYPYTHESGQIEFRIDTVVCAVCPFPDFKMEMRACGITGRADDADLLSDSYVLSDADCEGRKVSIECV